MNNKIEIYTDACNINNSGKCRISSIIKFNGKSESMIEYYSGKINMAELIAVLRILEHIDKDYCPMNFIIDVYSDHAPNVKFLNSIIYKTYEESEKTFDKLNRALKRKGLTWHNLDVIIKLQNTNKLYINWIPRKENKEADKLSKCWYNVILNMRT
jgi:ribonuclease HI